MESSAAWAVQHLWAFPRLWLHVTIYCFASQQHVRRGRSSPSESDAAEFGQSSQLRQMSQFSRFSSNSFSRREFEVREDIERLVGYTRGQHASGKSICEFGAHKILSQYSIQPVLLRSCRHVKPTVRDVPRQKKFFKGVKWIEHVWIFWQFNCAIARKRRNMASRVIP